MMFNGTKLRRLRHKKRLTYTELMQGLSDMGLPVSHPTLINWEKNRTTPDANKLKIVAEYFRVKIDYFFN